MKALPAALAVAALCLATPVHAQPEDDGGTLSTGGSSGSSGSGGSGGGPDIGGSGGSGGSGGGPDIGGSGGSGDGSDDPGEPTGDDSRDDDSGPTPSRPDPGAPLADPSGTSDASTGSASGGLDGQLRLSALRDAQIATAEIGDSGDHWRWRLAVSGPINRGAERSVVPNLDALTGLTRVEAEVSYLHWKPSLDIEEVTRVCAAFQAEEYVCRPDHPSTALIRDDMKAALDGVCAARACSLDSLPSKSAKGAWKLASVVPLNEARTALCAAQRAAIEASPPTCTRAQVAATGNGVLLRRFDLEKNEDARRQICREVALSQFQCQEPTPEALEREAAKHGLIEARAAVCGQYQTCAEESLTDAEKRDLNARYTALCSADRSDIIARPKQRGAFCTRTQIARRAKRYADSLDPAGRSRAGVYRALLARMDAAVHYGQTILVSARVEAARETFRFAEATTLDPDSVTENMGAATLAIAGVIPKVGSVIASYEFSRAFVAGRSTDLCRPTSVPDITECNTIAIGAPTRVDSHIARLELRRFFSANLALAIRASYDLENDVFGFELPFYFMHAKAGGLAGGVSAGFRSDEDAPIASIFVSKTLTLLPR